MKIRTKLFKFNEKTHNGRIYPLELSEYFLKDLPIYGHISDDDNNDIGVNLKNVSHVIDNLELFENELYGDIKILDTPKGKVLSDLMKDNLLYISSRGMGSIREDSVYDYKLISFDIGTYPAFEDCCIGYYNDEDDFYDATEELNFK